MLCTPTSCTAHNRLSTIKQVGLQVPYTVFTVDSRSLWTGVVTPGLHSFVRGRRIQHDRRIKCCCTRRRLVVPNEFIWRQISSFVVVVVVGREHDRRPVNVRSPDRSHRREVSRNSIRLRYSEQEIWFGLPSHNDTERKQPFRIRHRCDSDGESPILTRSDSLPFIRLRKMK